MCLTSWIWLEEFVAQWIFTVMSTSNTHYWISIRIHFPPAKFSLSDTLMFTIAPPYRGAVNQHLVWVGQELSRKCAVHHDSLCLQTMRKRLTPNYEELNGKGWVGGINDNSSEQALILFDNTPMFLTNTEEMDSISHDEMEKTNQVYRDD